MIVKLLTEHHLKFLSLKGGCIGSSESTSVKMPHCWNSNATAQNFILCVTMSYSSYIATSQMQATDARKTFPCYDEPAIKAKFDITLVRKSHMQALSNMPIVSNETR